MSTSEQWKTQTLALLEHTHTWLGPYTGDIRQIARSSFDPYTTYYAITAYKALGILVPNSAATIRALQEAQGANGKFGCEADIPSIEAQIDTMSCLYYMVQSLDALQAQPHNTAAIIAHVNALQTAEGPYVGTATSRTAPIDVDTTILATRQALAILHTLQEQPHNSAVLHAWLLQQWNTDTLFSAVTTTLPRISIVAGISDALRLMGDDVRHLPNSNLRREWLRSLYTPIWNGSSEATAVDLFITSSWQELTQHLGVDGLVLPDKNSTFIQKLGLAQHTSGAFSLFLTNAPDIQGTYLAITTFAFVHQPVPHADMVQALFARQAREAGGFLSVTETNYSNPRFTNVSLDIRALCGASIVDSASLKEFGQESFAALDVNVNTPDQASPDAQIQYIYETFMLMRRFGLETAPLLPFVTQHAQAFTGTLHADQPLTQTQLVDTYYLTQLYHFDNAIVQTLQHSIAHMQTGDGVYGIAGHSNLHITWYALNILRALGINSTLQQGRERAVLWIHQQQSADGGYVEMGLPNVYSSFWAVESLGMLEGKVSPDAKLSRWLHTLLLSTGGVRAADDTKNVEPDLTATYDTLRLAQELGSVL